MEHPDNPLLDVALNAIREGATNTNPIQVEHIALAVEAVRAERDALAAKVARVEALIELNGGAFLKSDTKIKRVQEDRRRDLGAIVTTSMVTVADVRAALTEGTESA